MIYFPLVIKKIDINIKISNDAGIKDLLELNSENPETPSRSKFVRPIKFDAELLNELSELTHCEGELSIASKIINVTATIVDFWFIWFFKKVFDILKIEIINNPLITYNNKLIEVNPKCLIKKVKTS